eukprot:m.171129 g.171129  ORF g.171129 m.171129 type:complete len:57 (-) comp24218_c0_seq2:832-1002(-)
MRAFVAIAAATNVAGHCVVIVKKGVRFQGRLSFCGVAPSWMLVKHGCSQASVARKK